MLFLSFAQLERNVGSMMRETWWSVTTVAIHMIITIAIPLSAYFPVRNVLATMI